MNSGCRYAWAWKGLDTWVTSLNWLNVRAHKQAQKYGTLGYVNEKALPSPPIFLATGSSVSEVGRREYTYNREKLKKVIWNLKMLKHY